MHSDDLVEQHSSWILMVGKLTDGHSPSNRKVHGKAVAKTYKLLRNLLSGDAQSQWDCVCHKMQECDSWDGGNNKLPKEGVRICGLLSKTVLSCTSSQTSLVMLQAAVLHTAGSAQTPEGHCATAYLTMGVLNDYVRHLPMLKDSPKAVPLTKKGNISFGKADLATIVLVSVPMTWQNQYNLTHLTVPKLTRALLLDLESIKWVMVEG
jgi:hypothetical protein